MTAAERRPRRPNGAPEAIPISVKVPPEILAPAKAKAARDGVALSKVIVDHLAEYAAQ